MRTRSLRHSSSLRTPRRRNPSDDPFDMAGMEAYNTTLKRARQMGTAAADAARDNRQPHDSLRSAYAQGIVALVNAAQHAGLPAQYAVESFVTRMSRPRKAR